MRIARKIYTRSFSGATSFSRYLARHDRYDIFALFPTVLSILQQRRTTSLSIRTNRPARPFSTREECSRDTWLRGSCGTIIDSWPDRWGSASETLRDLLQLPLSPSERIGYATKWSGTRIKDSVVFSFEDQGITTLFHFSSISSFLALVTLFPLLSTPPSGLACHVPREPDVALTLANQLDFATRMRDQHD